MHPPGLACVTILPLIPFRCGTFQLSDRIKEIPKRTKWAITKLQSTSLHGISVSHYSYLPFKSCLFLFLDVRKEETLIRSENLPLRQKTIPKDIIFHIIPLRYTEFLRGQAGYCPRFISLMSTGYTYIFGCIMAKNPPLIASPILLQHFGTCSELLSHSCS